MLSVEEVFGGHRSLRISATKPLDEVAAIGHNQPGFADVAELADAQASGACGLRPVEVRLLSSAFFPNF